MSAPATAFFTPLERYLRHGIAGVQGWLVPTTASMVAQLLVWQVGDGIFGDVCEIGVHHGRLFLILANATIPGETALAVDVFGDQEKNVDRSGNGDRPIFQANFARYAPGARLEILQQSSLDLQTREFLSRRFRFVSIDGSHTADATSNDLWLAQKTLLPGGLVTLDDILSSHWTGVLTGLTRYFAAGGTLVPCALLPNKLLLADASEAAQHWKIALRVGFPLAVAKLDREFLDAVVDCYDEHAYYDLESGIGVVRERNDLVNECDAASARIIELEARLDAVYRSTSWRSSAPLRIFGRLVRKR